MTNRWKKKIVPGLAIAVLTLGLLGAATYAFAWNPTPTYEAAPNDVAEQVSVDDLTKAADLRVFFGHMSVGRNIMSGMRDVYAANDVPLPEIVEIAPGEVPELSGEGVLVHALIGENYHPLWKLENFDATLRAGLAEKIDVAMLKFCYLDVGWRTDTEALFAEYTKTMDALEADFPNIRFVHMTVPLTTGPYGIKDHLKIVLGREDNPAREEYNALMRAKYGPERLLDLAAIESTAPDGTITPELYAGYTSDGSHLNDTGSALVAAELAQLLASPGN